MTLDEIDLSYKDQIPGTAKVGRQKTVRSDIASSLYDSQAGYSVVTELTPLQSDIADIFNRTVSPEWRIRQIRVKQGEDSNLSIVLVYQRNNDWWEDPIEDFRTHSTTYTDGTEIISNNIISFFTFHRSPHSMVAVYGDDALTPEYKAQHWREQIDEFRGEEWTSPTIPDYDPETKTYRVPSSAHHPYSALYQLVERAAKEGLTVVMPVPPTFGDTSPIKRYEKLKTSDGTHYDPNLLLVELNLSREPPPQGKHYIIDEMRQPIRYVPSIRPFQHLTQKT